MVRIQAQAVLYHNDLASIRETLRAMANAVSWARKHRGMALEVSFAYGDASPEPLVDQGELDAWRALGRDPETGEELVAVSCRFFGFNSGSAHGQNLLAESWDGDYVLIMNPDGKVCPDFFFHMLKPFEKAEVAVTEARQCPIEHQKAFDVATGRTEWCTGACSMIRNSVFREVGGFDWKTFFLYCDDVDLSWRIKLAGYTLIYQPHAMVYHAKELSQEGGWMPSEAEIYYSAEAALMMNYKWCNDQQLQKLMEQYKRGAPPERKALATFKKRRREGSLPEKIHADRRIATFTGNYYARNRFTY